MTSEIPKSMQVGYQTFSPTSISQESAVGKNQTLFVSTAASWDELEAQMKEGRGLLKIDGDFAIEWPQKAGLTNGVFEVVGLPYSPQYEMVMNGKPLERVSMQQVQIDINPSSVSAEFEKLGKSFAMGFSEGLQNAQTALGGFGEAIAAWNKSLLSATVMDPLALLTPQQWRDQVWGPPLLEPYA